MNTSLKRTFLAFWIFGLVNNVLYVVILSAAVDLVGPTTPKATVLMADVLPSFIIKLLSPFFIHLIPYPVRIFILVALSFTGMLIIVANFNNVSFILFGIVLASLSSGLGETTFLQLTHYYNELSLSAWSSGTGGAGLVGSFMFMCLTIWVGLSPRMTLLLFSIVPFSLILAFFKILPVPNTSFNTTEVVPKRRMSEVTTVDFDVESDNLLINDNTNLEDAGGVSGINSNINYNDTKAHFQKTLLKIHPYIFPFMLPLFTVYFSEYTINQGISPTLLFPIETTPFQNYRDIYVTYGTLYQLGVFISRSSIAIIKLKKIWYPSILQFLNLIIILLQSLFNFIPNIYIVFLIVLYEGLLGGLSYVNTFMLVTETVDLSSREFAMGCVGISDSAGIVIAAMVSMWLEPRLCNWQVQDGRDYCKLH